MDDNLAIHRQKGNRLLQGLMEAGWVQDSKYNLGLYCNGPKRLVMKSCVNIIRSNCLPQEDGRHYHQGVFLYGMLRLWEKNGHELQAAKGIGQPA